MSVGDGEGATVAPTPVPAQRADASALSSRWAAADRDDRNDRRRRYVTVWAFVFGVILVGFAGTVIALNLTLYSAQGFVGSYLAALGRHDVTSAVAMPGVALPRGTAQDLLAPEALGDLSDVRLVDDMDEGAGTHRVTFSFELNGTAGQSEFLVEHVGSRLGFFSDWRFAQAPTGTLSITPLGGPQFDANGVDVQSSAGANVPVAYAVLAPGVFTLSHESELLAAEPENILVLDPGASADVAVRIEANQQFVDLVQGQLNATLDACTEQEVLQPTGCPFGERITNRVEGTPKWSMAQYPQITIRRGAAPGTWEVPQTAAAAHLVVGVRSLFDGTRSTFDEDVPFTVSYVITLLPNGQVSIAAQ